MAIEAIGAAAVLAPAQAAGATRVFDLTPGSDTPAAAKFAQALDRAGAATPGGGDDVSSSLRGMIDVLDRVDLQARSVSDYAVTAQQSDGAMTPGEIVNLTMRCQEFMFQCQLTSNIANRSSDGVQQLFRQQG